MVDFNELRVSPDRKNLIIDVSIKDLSYYENVYIDSIIPTDHLRSIVNIGIDVVVNTKIINVKVPDD